MRMKLLTIPLIVREIESMKETGIYISWTFILISIISILGSGCNASGELKKSSFDPYTSKVTGEKVKDCSILAPNNPYEDDSGHFAGFEWQQENNGICDGNSESFNEGCEEFNRQQSDYIACINKK